MRGLQCFSNCHACPLQKTSFFDPDAMAATIQGVFVSMLLNKSSLRCLASLLVSMCDKF